MNRPAQFKALYPILGSREMEGAINFYTAKLGFELIHRDGEPPVIYAVLKRDAVVIHFQFQYEYEMQTTRLRLSVEDPDALFLEYQAAGALSPAANLRDTPWGTREFALYDPDRNSLTFFKKL